MIYNINITRNGIVNCNFTNVLQKTTHYENTPIIQRFVISKLKIRIMFFFFFLSFFFFFFFFFFFASYGDSPVYRCIPFTGAIHKIAVFYMFLRFFFAIFAVNVHDVLF